ncbi:MAG: hypothetical protein GY757_16070 [bacterium]|nr:hypothetical protein [bacterium]
MSENSPIFEEYTNEPSLANFLKKPKSWLIIFGILLGIILIAVFYKSAIIDYMPPEEVAKSIEVVWQDTKWVEKESTPYEIKIVPTISFKIKNAGTRPLQYVNFQGIFEFLDTDKPPHSDGGIRAFSEPLKPGETSEKLFIKAFYGYTGKSKASFANNTENWKKMRVKLYARTKGSPPVQVGDTYPVKQVVDGYESKNTGASTAEKDATVDAKSFERLGKSLQVTLLNSIWVDKLRSKAKSIIVPSITFQVKNLGKEPMKVVYFKGIFLFRDNGEELGQGLKLVMEKSLAPGEQTEEIFLQSELGYEATSKAAFIKNIQKWRKVDVKLFAKQKGYEYVLMGTYPIRQEIEGVKVYK